MKSLAQIRKRARLLGASGGMIRIKDWISSLLQNPLAWVFFVLFLVAEYWNYEHIKQLDTVCEAVPYADLLPYDPKTDLEKAQVICEDRRDSSDTLDE
jgi:hypothetical protein